MKISISTGWTNRLKITKADYDAMKSAVDKIIAAHPKAYASYKDAGASDMRYNWDVLRKSKFPITELYKYMDDNHINTALAVIIGNSGTDRTGRKR